MSKLTPAQHATFDAIVINAVFYDSLRAPISGFLVRRVVLPWLRSASEGTDKPPIRHGVAEIARSSRKIIAAKPEGKKLLALAQ